VTRAPLHRAPLLIALAAAGTLSAQQPPPSPVKGLSNAPALAAAYDAILNADFESVPAHLGRECDERPPMCRVMEAMAIWWRIALEPSDRSRDARFLATAEAAIAGAESWTEEQPSRAEAWFAVGAAYSARAQWRVERHERLAAARDGKRIKEALEQALAIDPQLHDAKFGLGMYRYYAAVAPTALRMLRWLLALPGGDRDGGLEQMLDARSRGAVLRGEADYQLHLIYLWYEQRHREALTIVQQLQTRYPRNPLFPLIEAEIHDVYFHDPSASVRALHALVARVDARRVNEPALARRRAELALRALHARTRR
jgi:tetratricopeptide (TPR) repeat protein